MKKLKMIFNVLNFKLNILKHSHRIYKQKIKYKCIIKYIILYRAVILNIKLNKMFTRSKC